MAAYSVNYLKVGDALGQMRKSAKDLALFKDDMEQISQSLRVAFQTPDMLNASHSVLLLGDRILNEAAHMDTLASALERIVTYYQSAEEKNALIDQRDTLSQQSIAVSKINWTGIWDWFRNALISIGIFKAEKTESQPVTRTREKLQDQYMQDEIARLLKKKRYTEKTWKSASVAERKNILNEYMQQVAQIMGLTLAPINYFYSESENGYYTLGQYSQDSRKISINEWVLENRTDSFSLMKTVVHELRHAYQHAACENPEQFIVSAETIQTWQDSFDNYKSQSRFMREGMNAEDAFQAYRAQAVEMDARKFARQ